MTSSVRLFLVALLGGALTLGFVPATQAAPLSERATVSVRVLADGQPKRGVGVWAVLNLRDIDKDDIEDEFGFFPMIQLGITGDDGQLRQVRNSLLNSFFGGRAKAGRWSLVYVDNSEQYATVRQQVDLKAGKNVLPDVTLSKGGTITGTVRTPSGLPVKNQYVVALPDTLDPENDLPVLGEYATAFTRSNGTYTLHNTAAQPHRVYPTFEHSDSLYGSVWTRGAVPGGTVAAKDVRVRVEPRLRVLARKRLGGKMDVVVKVGTAYYGVAKPGGTVEVLYGKGKVKRFKATGGSQKVTIRVPKKTYRVKVRYSGSKDVLGRTVFAYDRKSDEYYYDDEDY